LVSVDFIELAYLDNCSPKNTGWCYFETEAMPHAKDLRSKMISSDISSVSDFIFTFGNRIEGLGTGEPEL